MVRKPQVESKFRLRDGKGEVEFHYIISAEEMMGHGPMYAKLVLKPGSSIGRHQHVGNKEPYYILSGTGLYTDNDGSVTTVGPGDVCWTPDGEGHSLMCTSEEPLEFIALVVYSK